MAKSVASVSKEDEPSIAPVPDRWYDISLGPSFGHPHPSSKFCTLRYEFKPASVDKSQPGLLRKKRDNRVTVEFQNNQHGKPKVVFDGVAEDYKDNDAVLFFDGETFRLERLHRAVKRLRHMRVPGESAAAVAVGPAVESNSPLDGKAENLQNCRKGEAQDVPVEVERIDMGNSETVAVKPEDENTADKLPPSCSTPKGLTELTNDELEEHLDIIDSDDDHEATDAGNLSRREIHSSIDINVPHQDEDDDEIANVDVSDDEGNLGYNAAEALRAQVAGERQEQSSTSSSSSDSEGSESSSDSGSDSGSGSSGSDSESSDGDSVSSI